ncbi:hypothetical protein H5410_042196 [Solanum commersonii]|uniref:Uncharacterized protein n=1 Tax=Solanum commersonii TaxID=4109 RepID=A0A9J5XVB0_SOLCO|nr:hypothetical protein H5410_042196 [Solanum commersonii]
MDVRYDLSYGSSWSRRAIRLILKVKRPLDQVSPIFADLSYAIDHEFLVIQNFDMIFAKIFHGRLHWQTGPISRLNYPIAGKPPIFVDCSCAIFHGVLVIWIFDVIFIKNFYGHTLRPLLWNQLVLTGKPAHFKGKPVSRSNKPQSSPWIFGVLEFPSNFCQKFSCTFIKTLVIEPVGLNEQADSFSKSNEPKASKPPDLPIFHVLHIPWIFGDPEFQHDFCRNISWTSIKILTMDSFGPGGKTGPFPSQLVPIGKPTHFQGQTSPGAEFRHDLCQKILWTSVKTLAIDPVGFDGKTDLFLMSNEIQILGFLVILNSNMIFAEFFHGRPLRYSSLRQLVSMGKPTHFQGSINPRACKPVDISCVIVHRFLVPTVKSVNFQGQTRLEQTVNIKSVGPDG